MKDEAGMDLIKMKLCLQLLNKKIIKTKTSKYLVLFFYNTCDFVQ